MPRFWGEFWGSRHSLPADWPPCLLRALQRACERVVAPVAPADLRIQDLLVSVQDFLTVFLQGEFIPGKGEGAVGEGLAVCV